MGKDKKKYRFEFEPEICCDLCNEVIHNHFECPICKDTYAGTDIYGPIYDDAELGFVFECKECKAKFILVGGIDDKMGFYYDNLIWERID